MAGKLALKAGLFKVLLGFLLAGKKALIALFALIVAGLSRLMGKKKIEPDVASGVAGSSEASAANHPDSGENAAAGSEVDGGADSPEESAESPDKDA